jgi:flagellar motor switch/type III secretory pathway protein FliN
VSELTPHIVDLVIAACQAGAAEAAGAIGRVLDAEPTLAVGEPSTYSADAPPAELAGPGLATLLTFGDAAFAAILPESSGLLPAWYAAPDPTGESKLSTLAQELSMLLVPETLMADQFAARRVEDAAAALGRGGVAADAVLVPLTLTADDKSTTLWLVWPLAAPQAFFAAAGAAAESGDEPTSAETVATEAVATPAKPAKPAEALKPPRRPSSVYELPKYARSLLRVRVPISVELAAKKEFVAEVVEIAPGSIIKFNKGCDQPLRLVIGGQPVAEGEAVKVGDKFGFRVSAILLPQEQFLPVRIGRASAG